MLVWNRPEARLVLAGALAMAALSVLGCASEPPPQPPPDCNCEEELKDGGFAKVRIFVEGGSEPRLRVWPSTVIVEYADAEHRMFDGQFRVRWLADSGALEAGQKLAIEVKQDRQQVNGDLFGPRIELTADEDDRSRLVAESGFPLREPTWEGWVHPHSNQFLVDDALGDELAELAKQMRAANVPEDVPPVDPNFLVGAYGGKTLRVARWHYDVVLYGAGGEELYRLDPVLILKECP